MGSTGTILKGDDPRSIWMKFGFMSFNGSEDIDFHKIANFQPIRSHIGHPGCRARSSDTILQEDHQRSLTSKFGPIWPRGS
jgi:hypothetical protein